MQPASDPKESFAKARQNKKPISREKSFFIDSADDFKTQSSSFHSQAIDNKNEVNNTLGSLSKKFVQLIKNSPNQTIEIQQASQRLGIQRRRIYDITNVLQGIGYIQKLGKNMMKWVGGQQGTQLQFQVRRMQHQSEQLYGEIQHIEEQIAQLKNQLYTISNQTTQLNYFNTEDIKLLMKAMKVKSILIYTGDSGNQVQILSKPQKKTSQWTIQSGSTLNKLYYCKLINDDLIEITQNPSFDKRQQSQEKYQKAQMQFTSQRKSFWLKNANRQKFVQKKNYSERQFLNQGFLLPTVGDDKGKESVKQAKNLLASKMQ